MLLCCTAQHLAKIDLVHVSRKISRESYDHSLPIPDKSQLFLPGYGTASGTATGGRFNVRFVRPALAAAERSPTGDSNYDAPTNRSQSKTSDRKIALVASTIAATLHLRSLMWNRARTLRACMKTGVPQHETVCAGHGSVKSTASSSQLMKTLDHSLSQ